jgi:LEA14-like dessication related protein
MLPFVTRNARRLALVGVLVAVLAGGAVVTGMVGTPEVTDVENRFAGVDDTTTTVATDLVVSNPLPVGVSADDLTVRYAIDMNGLRMARGEQSGVSVGTGRSRVETRTTLANDRIPEWWVSHIQRGEQTTLAVDATVHSGTVDQALDAPAVRRQVTTDVLSGFNSSEPRPVEANQPPISDPVLYVNETAAHWGTVTRETTTMEASFTVYNPNPYPVALTELGYTTTMNDVTVGSGESEREYVISPHSSRTIETTTRIDNDRLDEWWVTHLERNQRTDLRISFSATFDTAAGTVAVPLDPLAYTTTIETDIFGTKSETAPGNATTSAPGSSTARDSTQTDSTPATTASAGDPSTHASATTTDGGILGGASSDAAPTPTPTPGNPTHAPTSSGSSTPESGSGSPTPSGSMDGGTNTTVTETDDGLL